MSCVETNFFKYFLKTSDSLIVTTAYGKIKGTTLKAIQDPDLEFIAFRGIPYAKPPLKKLRFQPPLKPDFWNDTKSCQDYGSPCLQISPKDGHVFGSEDCLTLNVFRRNSETDLEPVLFWIHGGAHMRKSSRDFGPDYFMDKDVVLVTVNYRLNVFGFLSVNDENAYGNVAMKDQIAALEWVRDNIKNFGGDPGRVTIFGESSGADCVHLLQLSKRTKGLFQRVIAESGSALSSRYLQRNPLKYVYNLAKHFNLNTGTTKEIVVGLQSVDGEELAKAANSSEILGKGIDLEAAAFYPIIEVENNNAIITTSPYELLEKGDFNQVPFIFGYNTNEGTLGLGVVKSEMNVDDFDENFSLFAPRSLNNEKDQHLAGAEVREYFLGNSSARDNRRFAKFLGQELIVRGVRKSLELMRQHSEGYFYRFSYKGTHTSQYGGVGHAEELQYLFVISGKTKNLNENDILTRRRMVEMWTNFAAYGSPILNGTLLAQNVKWNKSNKSSVIFLDIGKDLVDGINPDGQEYEFWEQLFDEFGVKPYLTY